MTFCGFVLYTGNVRKCLARQQSYSNKMKMKVNLIFVLFWSHVTINMSLVELLLSHGNYRPLSGRIDQHCFRKLLR